MIGWIKKEHLVDKVKSCRYHLTPLWILQERRCLRLYRRFLSPGCCYRCGSACQTRVCWTGISAKNWVIHSQTSFQRFCYFYQWKVEITEDEQKSCSKQVASGDCNVWRVRFCLVRTQKKWFPQRFDSDDQCLKIWGWHHNSMHKS